MSPTTPPAAAGDAGPPRRPRRSPRTLPSPLRRALPIAERGLVLLDSWKAPPALRALPRATPKPMCQRACTYHGAGTPTSAWPHTQRMACIHGARCRTTALMWLPAGVDVANKQTPPQQAMLGTGLFWHVCRRRRSGALENHIFGRRPPPPSSSLPQLGGFPRFLRGREHGVRGHVAAHDDLLGFEVDVDGRDACRLRCCFVTCAADVTVVRAVVTQVRAPRHTHAPPHAARTRHRGQRLFHGGFAPAARHRDLERDLHVKRATSTSSTVVCCAYF